MTPEPTRATLIRSHRKSHADRQAAALERLQRARLKKAQRLAGSTSCPLVQMAVETIQLVEQRIRYWLQHGDAEHVRRLEAIRRQLMTTYLQ